MANMFDKILEGVRREEMFGKQAEEFKEKDRQLQQQIEQLSGRMNRQMEQLSERVNRQMEQFSKGMDAKLAQVSIELDTGMVNLNGKLDTGMENLNGKLDTGMESLNGKLDTGMANLDGKLDIGIAGLNRKLDVCKGELADKVHSENVKSYRNMQALVEELSGKLEAKEQNTERRKSARGLLRAVLVVGILNLLTMAGWILYDLGILEQLMHIL